MIDQFNTPMSTYQGWNIDPAYMTPAYMAQFRPSYDRGAADNPYAPRFGLGYSMHEAMTPFRDDIRSRDDPTQYYGAHRSNIGFAPMDAAMWAGQNAAIPMAAWYGADRLMAGGANRFGSAIGRGIAGRIGMGALGGAAGGFMAGAMLPMAAATMASGAMSSTFVDPYVEARRGASNWRDRLGDTFVAGQGANASGAYGISNQRAVGLSRAITEAGARDYTFNAEDFNAIADYGMSSGMFNNIGNMDVNRITEGVKAMADNVKTIMTLANTDSVKEAIDYMGRMRGAGVENISQMGTVMRMISSASAASGVSVDQLMNTVGNQGQMIASQYGVAPILGQTQAADIFAGFSSARRSGLISAGQVAALGGMEGMTQNVMQGGMRMMSSPMGQMMMMGGVNPGSSVVGTTAAFGAQFSADPYGTMGRQFMNQGANMSEFIAQDGMVNGPLKMLQGLARAAGMDPSKIENLATVAQQNGYSSQEFQSLVLAYQAEQDPTNRTNRALAAEASGRRETANTRQREGIGMAGFWGAGAIQNEIRQIGSGIRGFGAETGTGPLEASAWLADKWERATAAIVGVPDTNRDTALGAYGERISLESGEWGGTYTSPRTGITAGGSFSSTDKWTGVITGITNQAAKAEGQAQQDARELMSLLGRDDYSESDLKRIEELAYKVNTQSGGAVFGTSDPADVRTRVKQLRNEGAAKREIRRKKVTQVTEGEFQRQGDAYIAERLGDRGVSAPVMRGAYRDIYSTNIVDAVEKRLDGMTDAQKVEMLKAYGSTDKEARAAVASGIKEDVVGEAVKQARKSKETLPTTKGAYDPTLGITVGAGIQSAGEANIGGEADLRARLSAQGLSEEQATDYIRQRGGQRAIENTLNTGFIAGIFGFDNETDTKLSEDVKKYLDDLKSGKSDDSLDIDTSAFKDIGKNLDNLLNSGDLASQMKANSFATNELTQQMKQLNERNLRKDTPWHMSTEEYKNKVGGK